MGIVSAILSVLVFSGCYYIAKAGAEIPLSVEGIFVSDVFQALAADSGYLARTGNKVAFLPNLLYKYLREKSPELINEACKKVIEQGIKFLQPRIVKLCKQNKLRELTKYLAKYGTKGFVTWGLTNVLPEKVAALPIPAVGIVVNPLGLGILLGIVADTAQFVLEVYEYREIGEQVGMWGNIGAGAVVGAAVGGPVGVPIGTLVGFGKWMIGEAVGAAIEDIC